MVLCQSVALMQPLQIGPKSRSYKSYLLLHLLACLLVLLFLPLAIVFVKLNTLLTQRTLLSLKATCVGCCICFWNHLGKNSWTPWWEDSVKEEYYLSTPCSSSKSFTKASYSNSSATLENAIYVPGTEVWFGVLYASGQILMGLFRP